jgi:hypothetical protein
MEQEQLIIEPPLYFANDHVFDIDFHPQFDLLSCCLVTGEVKLYFIIFILKIIL